MQPARYRSHMPRPSTTTASLLANPSPCPTPTTPFLQPLFLPSAQLPPPSACSTSSPLPAMAPLAVREPDPLRSPARAHAPPPWSEANGACEASVSPQPPPACPSPPARASLGSDAGSLSLPALSMPPLEESSASLPLQPSLEPVKAVDSPAAPPQLPPIRLVLPPAQPSEQPSLVVDASSSTSHLPVPPSPPPSPPSTPLDGGNHATLTAPPPAATETTAIDPILLPIPVIAALKRKPKSTAAAAPLPPDMLATASFAYPQPSTETASPIAQLATHPSPAQPPPAPPSCPPSSSMPPLEVARSVIATPPSASLLSDCELDLSPVAFPPRVASPRPWMADSAVEHEEVQRVAAVERALQMVEEIEEITDVDPSPSPASAQPLRRPTRPLGRWSRRPPPRPPPPPPAFGAVATAEAHALPSSSARPPSPPHSATVSCGEAGAAGMAPTSAASASTLSRVVACITRPAPPLSPLSRTFLHCPVAVKPKRKLGEPLTFDPLPDAPSAFSGPLHSTTNGAAVLSPVLAAPASVPPLHRLATVADGGDSHLTLPSSTLAAPSGGSPLLDVSNLPLRGLQLRAPKRKASDVFYSSIAATPPASAKPDSRLSRLPLFPPSAPADTADGSHTLHAAYLHTQAELAHTRSDLAKAEEGLEEALSAIHELRQQVKRLRAKLQEERSSLPHAREREGSSAEKLAFLRKYLGELE